MATLFNDILYAIRGRCLSDAAASVAASEVAELVVKKFTTTNSARSEIAAICIELDCCMYEKFTKEMYVELRRRLRQLSSIA